MSMFKWTSIESFNHMAKTVMRSDHLYRFKGSVVDYRAKVKLHGTNAGVQLGGDKIRPQSRTAVLVGKDNAGFGAWVRSDLPYWTDVRQRVKSYLTNRFPGSLWDIPESITLFGEWCGPGVQKGVAVNQLPEKMFCIFSLVFTPGDTGSYIISDPDVLRDFVGSHTNVWVLPWDHSVTIDFGSRGNIEKSLSEINQRVLEVEECDPWVKNTFGVEGLGEGLVYYPVSITQAYEDPTVAPVFSVDTSVYSVYSTYVFKAKGEKHRVVVHSDKSGATTGKSAILDVEQLESIQAFVDMFCTENRLEQGFSELFSENESSVTMKDIGAFLKWMNDDIYKESLPELEESGLEWKPIGKEISNRSKIWFQTRAQIVFHPK